MKPSGRVCLPFVLSGPAASAIYWRRPAPGALRNWLKGTVAALALWAAATPGLAAPEWDIVGVRLGMTEQQARAAIQAHSARAQITERTLKFTFSDGARQVETPAFLATIQVHIPAPPGTMDNENLKIEFSAPPTPQRVIGVRRDVAMWSNPPSVDRMLDSLTQKYGKPQAFTLGGLPKAGRADWAEAGKSVCGQQPGKPLVMPSVSQSPRDLRLYQQWQQQRLAPADLSNCAARLAANLTIKEGGSSVVSLMTEMNDYAYMLPALQASAKWLAEQEADARKARLNSGATPKL
jgi:hypothetical protein